MVGTHAFNLIIQGTGRDRKGREGSLLSPGQPGLHVETLWTYCGTEEEALLVADTGQATDRLPEPHGHKRASTTPHVVSS